MVLFSVFQAELNTVHSVFRMRGIIITYPINDLYCGIGNREGVITAGFGAASAD